MNRLLMSRTSIIISNFYIIFDPKNSDVNDQQFFESIFKNCRTLLENNPTKVIRLTYGPTSLTNFSKALRNFFIELRIEPGLMLDICRVNHIFVDPCPF